MPSFTGTAITLSIQDAFADAVRQALITKAQIVGETVNEIEVKRIYSVREEAAGFNKVHVEIEVK